MKGFLRMNLAPNIALSMLLCKLLRNFISYLALLDGPKLDSHSLSDGTLPQILTLH